MLGGASPRASVQLDLLRTSYRPVYTPACVLRYWQYGHLQHAQAATVLRHTRESECVPHIASSDQSAGRFNRARIAPHRSLEPAIITFLKTSYDTPFFASP